MMEPVVHEQGSSVFRRRLRADGLPWDIIVLRHDISVLDEIMASDVVAAVSTDDAADLADVSNCIRLSRRRR